MVFLTTPAAARRRLRPRAFCAAAVLAALLSDAGAEDVYLAPESFVAEAFPAVPKPSVLWLTPPLQAAATSILGHPPRNLRQRFWSDGNRSAWILEEIGKEEPITAGFVVRNGRIEQARVLIYRESRGGEIRYTGFLKQFAGVGLAADRRLDHPIDGISGATLSVGAMDRMARLALFYASQ
jgi:FMN-binding domain